MNKRLSHLKNKYFGNGGILFTATMVTVLVFSIFGGSEPKVNFNLGLMFLSGLFLIYAAAASNAFATFASLPLYVQLVIVAPILLPLVQITPLPPELWSVLPGQLLRYEVLGLVEMNSSWQPLSMVPKETAYSTAMGIMTSTIILSCIMLSKKSLEKIIYTVGGVAVIGCVIGAFQFSGSFPSLSFYKHSHTNTVIGFFANKNHMGLVLAITLLISRYIFENSLSKRLKFLYYLFMLCIAVAILATNSRAGIVLGVIAILFIFTPKINGLSKKLFIIGFLIVALAFYYISSSPTFELVYKRFSDTGDDVRWNFLVNSISLTRDFFIFGSGYGSFSDIYMTRESIEALSPVYTNHLHNDYLQLLIEGGLLGMSALALLAYSIFKGWQKIRRMPSHRELAWLGLCIITLFGLHSVVDYPLRRPAALIYFCIGLACMFRPWTSDTGALSNKEPATQTA